MSCLPDPIWVRSWTPFGPAGVSVQGLHHHLLHLHQYPGHPGCGAVSTIISVLVLIAFGLVAAVGFAQWQTNPFVPFIPPGQSLLQSVGYGLAIGMWVYSGYESMSTVAGEIKDPQVIPRATLLTVPLIMAVYILPTMGGLASLGRWSEWASEGGLTYGDVVTQVAPALGVFFVFIAVIAQFSIFNTYIASGSRGFFALAEDNLAPQDPRQVQQGARCSLCRGAVAGYLQPDHLHVSIREDRGRGRDALHVRLCVDLHLCLHIARQRGDLPRPFRVPIGTKAFIAMCIPSLIIIFIAFFISGTDYFVGGMAALVSGPIMYFIFKRRYGGLTKIDPVNYPVNSSDRAGHRRYEENGVDVRRHDARRCHRIILPALV